MALYCRRQCSILSFRSKQNTRNKSAEFLENRNKFASVHVPPEQIREPEQIRCDNGTTLINLPCVLVRNHYERNVNKKVNITQKMSPDSEKVEATSPNEKVALTNWKRLPCVPAEVCMSQCVQPGVHWREYIVFLDGSSDRLYLYHIKMGMWSTLISKGSFDSAKGSPLAVFGASHDDQDLILVSKYGSIYKYFVENGCWKIFDKLDTYGELQINNRTSTSIYATTYYIKCVVVATANTTSDQSQSLFLLWQENPKKTKHSRSSKEHLYLRRFQHSEWTDPVELVDTNFLTDWLSHVSYAISQSNLYVNIGALTSVIYCMNAQNVVTKIPLPSLNKTTICSVKDTMFSFGGRVQVEDDEEEQPSSDVNRYNSSTMEWEPAGYMRSCRYSVIVTPILLDKADKIFVVGGDFGEVTDSDSETELTHHCRIAEICDISP